MKWLETLPHLSLHASKPNCEKSEILMAETISPHYLHPNNTLMFMEEFFFWSYCLPYLGYDRKIRTQSTKRFTILIALSIEYFFLLLKIRIVS